MSTSADMLHFASMLMGEGVYEGTRVLSSSAIEQMGTNQVPGTLDVVSTSATQYGLGWDTVQDGALESVGKIGWAKNGGVPYYTSQLILDPEDHLAVIVVSVSPGSASSSTKIADKILLRALVEKGAITSVPKVITDLGPSAVTPDKGTLARLSGIYLAYDGAYKVTANADRAVHVATLVDGTWQRVGALGTSTFTYRGDGCFWSTTVPGLCLRSGQGWGRHYLVMQTPAGVGNYLMQIARAQKVTSDTALSDTWRTRSEETWLFASNMPTEANWLDLVPSTLVPVPGLDGYLQLQPFGTPFDTSGSQYTAAMPVVIPAVFGRDLEDLVATSIHEEGWLTYGNFQMRPVSTMRTLPSGATDVTFAGVAEWRKLASAGLLDISGDVGAWFVYGEEFGVPVASGIGTVSGVQIPVGGGYVVLMGTDGQTATVTIS